VAKTAAIATDSNDTIIFRLYCLSKDKKANLPNPSSSEDPHAGFAASAVGKKKQ
jgi:hypothetical protein